MAGGSSSEIAANTLQNGGQLAWLKNGLFLNLDWSIKFAVV
jgi:hypothetical protein